MQARADALPLAGDPVRERLWPQTVTQSLLERCDLTRTADTEKAEPAHPPLQVTPELMEFYRNHAHDLRAEAIRNAQSAVWSFLTRIVRPR